CFNSLLSCPRSRTQARLFGPPRQMVKIVGCARQETGPEDAGLTSSHARVGYRMAVVSSRGCLTLGTSIGPRRAHNRAGGTTGQASDSPFRRVRFLAGVQKLMNLLADIPGRPARR